MKEAEKKDTKVTFTFLQQVKEGVYTENKDSLKTLRMPVFKTEVNTEDQYYYSTR